MTEITKEKLSNLRKYFVEYTVFALAASVIGLFMMYVKLNDKINGQLMDQVIQTRTAIERNTIVIQSLNLRK